MTATTTLDIEALPFGAAARDKSAFSAEELAIHAEKIGTSVDLINVQDISMPDFVTITIGKPDGRKLRRVIPRECWEEEAYRASVLREMASILA